MIYTDTTIYNESISKMLDNVKGNKLIIKFTSKFAKLVLVATMITLKQLFNINSEVVDNYTLKIDNIKDWKNLLSSVKAILLYLYKWKVYKNSWLC